MHPEQPSIEIPRVNRSTGFTLTEVIIAVAIVGILVSFALPSYTQYVVRAKLTESTSGLAEFRHLLEQYYQDNRNYGPASGECGDTNNNSALDSGEPALPTGDYFTFTCAVTADTQGYTVTAASQAAQGLGSAGAYTFTLDEDNTQRTTAFPGASGLPLSCWISKQDSTC